MKFLTLTTVSLCFVVSLAASTAYAQTGLVASISKAPVTPDGDVAGAVTDFVINLAVDQDPSEPGLKLDAGESIRVVLPDAFVFTDPKGRPITDLFGAKDCVPTMLKCSTGGLLQGWPQHPILPSFPPGKEPQYTFSYDEEANSVIFTAVKDIDGVPLPGPGIKAMHMLLLGFTNPKQPGYYPIRVSFHSVDGAERAAGVGKFMIRPAITPSINITSVFVPGDENGGNPPNPNTIYQETTAGAITPMPWDFLIWDSNGNAYEGLEIVSESETGGSIVHNETKVGTVTISTPVGATGQGVSGGPSVKIPGTPLIGSSFGAPIPTGRLTAIFTAGSEPGRYFTTFTLDGGNSATMVVDVLIGE
jgi:hypothetical protein